MGMTSTDNYAKNSYEIGQILVFSGTPDFHIVQITSDIKSNMKYDVKFLFSSYKPYINTVSEFQAKELNQFFPTSELHTHNKDKNTIRYIFLGKVVY